MSLYNPTVALGVSQRQAGSLSRTVAWHLRRTWAVLERCGQRRAAPEMARAAARFIDSKPALAAELTSLARQWRSR